MSIHFIARPVMANTNSKFLAKLIKLEIGVVDDDSICIMFKFDKRCYFSEECLSYSGARWIWSVPDVYPSMDELAELIVVGYEGVCGLCTGGSSPYPNECDFSELSTDTSMLSDEMVEYYQWLVDNKSAIVNAVNRYAADENHYVDFSDDFYV